MNSNQTNPEWTTAAQKADLTHSNRLDLGCSYHKLDGYIGLDILRTIDLDVQADACFLPFKDNSIDEIYSQYALEHIPDNLAVLSEMYRVCKPGTMIRLILPHFSNPAFYDDLTHCHNYTSRTWEHYDQEMHALTGHPNYLPGVNFKLRRVELRWWPPDVIRRKVGWKRALLNTLNGLINRMANSHLFFCERIWCGWVGGFYEIDYTLEVMK